MQADTATCPQEQTAVEGQTEVDSASEHVEVRADLQQLHQNHINGCFLFKVR